LFKAGPKVFDFCKKFLFGSGISFQNNQLLSLYLSIYIYHFSKKGENKIRMEEAKDELIVSTFFPAFVVS